MHVKIVVEKKFHVLFVMLTYMDLLLKTYKDVT